MEMDDSKRDRMLYTTFPTERRVVVGVAGAVNCANGGLGISPKSTSVFVAVGGRCDG